MRMIDVNPDELSRVASPGVLYDPAAPVPPPSPARLGFSAAPSRQNQRRRRAMILATIRQLIMTEGGDGVTVRAARGHLSVIDGVADDAMVVVDGPLDELHERAGDALVAELAHHPLQEGPSR